MKPIINVMVDIETLGTNAGSTILSIGAATFGRFPGPLTTFYLTIDRESCKPFGFFEEYTTQEWWKMQSKEAIESTFEAASGIEEVLESFAYFLRELRADGANSLRLWGNAASFDLGLLAAAYRICQKEVPWNFREEMCFRTLRNIFSYVKPPEFQGTPHVAICDALHQAAHAELILQKAIGCDGN